MLLEHMHTKFENRTKIKGGCHLGRKVVPHDSKSDLPLVFLKKSGKNSQILSDIKRILTGTYFSKKVS